MGGRRAITGFLFQILRGAKLGLDLSARIVIGKNEAAMTLTLEPVGGGDHRANQPNRTIIEQVKFRAAHRRWSAGEIARDVFPDLIRATRPGASQTFRLITSHDDGLGPINDYLLCRRSGADALLPWGRERIDVAAFTARLAKKLGINAEDARLTQLLDNFEIEAIDFARAEDEVDSRLQPMLAPDVDVASKRHELTSRLLDVARESRTLTAGELLDLVGPDALRRLQHARTLRDNFRDRLAFDCKNLGYEAEHQARLAPPPVDVFLSVLSGESGQGKTWSLCQAALTRAESGKLAIAFRSPGSMDGFVKAINERIWLQAYDASAELPVIARRLAPIFADQDGCWLTIYLDDLQERDFAGELARLDWRGLGVRLVVTAQPRIAHVMESTRADVATTPIASFTSAELRRYLGTYGRNEPLETMPDDVFELLQKPIHARMYMRLPHRSHWVDASEYELFKTYWTFATTETRDQPDHYDDSIALLQLAAALLGPASRYPWSPHDLAQAGLSAEALRRLEAVGLLRREGEDVRFSSDRMLNWAVAEHLTAHIVGDNPTASQIDEVLARIDPTKASEDRAVVRRLSYVMLDTMWLLLGTRTPSFIAELILALIERNKREWLSEALWTDMFGTLGAGLLPALEVLAARAYDEQRGWEIPRNLHLGIVAAAAADPNAAAATVSRLLQASDQERAIGLRTAAQISMPRNLDQIWMIHTEREHARFEARGAGDEAWHKAMVRRDQSYEALKPSIAAAPDWLESTVLATTEPTELNALVWLMLRIISPDRARSMWNTTNAHLFASLPADSDGLIEALKEFGGAEHRQWLEAVPLDRDKENATISRLLRTRAHLDPEKALEQIRERNEEYTWSASNWWLRALYRYDPRRLGEAVRENASKGDDPLTDVLLTYSNDTALIDPDTLQWILDRSAEKLRAFNDEQCGQPDRELGRTGHILRVLPKLTETWQFDALAARAGTTLEHEFLRFASARTGRVSNYADSDGAECTRILAMIGASGYDNLVVRELGRENPHGREDGYNSAHWSEAPSITKALLEAPKADGEDGYRQSIRTQALAIHQCDANLEAMARRGVPVFVNAAEMRSADGRPTEALQARVETLIATGDLDDLRTAAALAGYLREPDQARALIPQFVDATTPEPIRRTMIGTFRALGFYDSTLLPLTRKLFEGLIDEQAQFVANYLAAHGDAAARSAVVEWASALDFGVFSLSQHSFLDFLLDHDDSRDAVIAFIRRSREQGHLLRSGREFRLLADAGDHEAQDALIRSAYRKPQSFGSDTVAGIRYLKTIDADEAFFAAARLLARHNAPAAIDVLLEIDPLRALDLLITRHRTQNTLGKWQIGRRLPRYIAPEILSERLEALATSSAADDQRVAIELAAWMSPDMYLPWLDTFIDTPSLLRETAHNTLRIRAGQRAAIEHIRAMAASSKALKWARLNTIIECVDPYMLAASDDQFGMQRFLNENAFEFEVEARRLQQQRYKNVENDAKRADRAS